MLFTNKSIDIPKLIIKNLEIEFVNVLKKSFASNNLYHIGS